MMRFVLATLSIAGLATAPIASLAVTHTVEQIGFTFVPDVLIVAMDDTVEWVWSAGSHTVTNGVHPDSVDTGTLFDAPLSAANFTFSFTFTEQGDVPYFCRPHRSFGMVGVIRVDPPVAVDEPVELSTWSRVKAMYR